MVFVPHERVGLNGTQTLFSRPGRKTSRERRRTPGVWARVSRQKSARQLAEEPSGPPRASGERNRFLFADSHRGWFSSVVYGRASSKRCGVVTLCANPQVVTTRGAAGFQRTGAATRWSGPAGRLTQPARRGGWGRARTAVRAWGRALEARARFPARRKKLGLHWDSHQASQPPLDETRLRDR